MAKDPAFLFYPNDFDAATKFLNNEQVGIYLRLLIAQFQHGRLSEKQVLFICKSYDDDIMCKFTKDDNNLYYNERLEFEILKRKNFSESRKNNRIGKNNKDMKNISKSYLKDMDEDMENENENENINKDIIKIPFGDDFKIKWEEWKTYKNQQHKFKYKSLKTEQVSLDQLIKLSNNIESNAIQIINQSIANGWKGFFNLKNNDNGTKKLNSEEKFDAYKQYSSRFN